MRARVFDEFAQTLHNGRQCEEPAKNIDFAAQLFRGKWLDKFLRGRGCPAIEFADLRGSGTSQAQSLAFGGHLARKAGGERLRCIDAASGKKQVANYSVAD